MFNKLVSNLPFNPSLINQVGFYAKRLRREASIRRLSFALVALTLILQLFAILSPAQPSLARSGNDIIPGGFTTKEEAVTHCRNNDFNFRTILTHFGISCNLLENNSTVTTIRSTDSNNTLYSMGRIPQGPINTVTGKVTNEVPVVIGNQTYYMRLLSSWDGNWVSTYKALSVGNIFGIQYFILFSCGNIVQHGQPGPPPAPTPAPPPPAPKPPPATPKPPPPKPKDVCPLIPGVQTDKSQCLPCPQSKSDTDTTSCLVPSKTAQNITQNIQNADNTTAHPGDVIVYTLHLHNNAKIGAKFQVFENMSDVLEYADITDLHGGTFNNDQQTVVWPAETVPAKTSITHQITVKVKDPIPNTPMPCPNQTSVSHCPASGSFDLTMTNVYGNAINIKLPKTIIKTTEIVTTRTLPNTGPGLGVISAFAITVVSGYFFARSRLLAKELYLIRNDYTTSGGM